MDKNDRCISEVVMYVYIRVKELPSLYRYMYIMFLVKKY